MIIPYKAKSMPVGTVDPEIRSKALERAKSETEGIDTQTEKNVAESFARARAGLQAREDVNARNIEADITRQQAQTPGGFGGAGIKLRQKALTEAAQGFQGAQSELAAQEAQAKAGLGEARAGRAVGFGQLAQQNEQFNKTMNFQWAELDENQKTNLVNAMIALKDAGFLDKTMDELNNFANAGLNQIYPGRVPEGNPRYPGYGISRQEYIKRLEQKGQMDEAQRLRKKWRIR